MEITGRSYVQLDLPHQDNINLITIKLQHKGTRSLNKFTH